MSLVDYIRAVPKVELHVHLEGSMPPETLLMLARRHGITLPADTVEGVREWFTFIDFPHFAQIYQTISQCLQTPDDIELLARGFLQEQARQNIIYTEATYTAYTIYRNRRVAFADQLAALNRARVWAENELGVTARWIIDLPREWIEPQEGEITARWLAEHYHDTDSGIAALGLGGYEVGFLPSVFRTTWEIAQAAGIPTVLHAGETGGADSIWSAIHDGKTIRIGHGVRCLEDAALVAYLRETQIPLEVCPTSNVCLGVALSLADHPLPKLIEAGLYVTLNSDDPPMFGTTLTDEYLRCAAQWGWDAGRVERLILNAAQAALLPDDQRRDLATRCEAAFARLRRQWLAEEAADEAESALL